MTPREEWIEQQLAKAPAWTPERQRALAAVMASKPKVQQAA